MLTGLVKLLFMVVVSIGEVGCDRWSYWLAGNIRGAGMTLSLSEVG